MPEDYTRVLPTEPASSWTNPQVAERNRHIAVIPGASHYQEPLKKPPFYLTRITVVLCLIPILLGLILSTSLAHWAQNTVVEDSGFSLVTSDMADDAVLQAELKTAVVDDVMANSTVQQFVGDGNSNGLLGGVQNWAHDQLEQTVTSRVEAVMSSSDYPQVWQQVMDASHTYNLQNPDAAGIDIAPIFNAVDAQIGSVLGFDPDLTKTTYIVPLESTEQSTIADNIQLLKNFGATWQAQLLATCGLALLILVLAPTRRFWWLSLMSILAAATLWTVSTLAGRLTLPNFGSETARVFATGLTDALTASLRSSLNNLSLWLVGAGVLFFLLAVAVLIVKLSAKGATARTQRILKALG